MSDVVVRTASFYLGVGCKGQCSSPLQALLGPRRPCGPFSRPRAARRERPGCQLAGSFVLRKRHLLQPIRCSRGSVDILDLPASTSEQSEEPTPSEMAPHGSSSSRSDTEGTGRPYYGDSSSGSRLRAAGSAGSPTGPVDHPTLQAIQAATAGKLAELQHVVEEVGPGLGEGATMQLEEVLHKLEQLEQDLSAALHVHSASSDSEQQHQQAAESSLPPAAAAAAASLPAAAAAGSQVEYDADAGESYVVVVASPMPSPAAKGPASAATSASLATAAAVELRTASAAAIEAGLQGARCMLPGEGLGATAITPVGAAVTPAAAVAAAGTPAAAVAAAGTSAAAVAASTSTAGTSAAAVAASTSTATAPAAAGPGQTMVVTPELEAAAAAASIGASGDWDAAASGERVGVTSAAEASTSSSPPEAAAAGSGLSDSAKLWALFVLGLSYVHQATSGFALPAMLPMISPDLHLSDFQGAMLTSGYSYLYALALVPVGLLADRVNRPKLLAVGLTLWSSLSMLAAGAGSFKDLLLVRTGFAVAQATQNPVSFSLIPDLFPANKSTALAAYNCAIYLGRALSFASVLAAHRIGAGKGAEAAAAVGGAAGPPGEIALSMVPLEKLDLQRMSIIYTAGDMAAVTPVYNYNFNVIAYEAAAGMDGGGWRDMLTFIGYPGFIIAAMLMLSVKDPRKAQALAEGANEHWHSTPSAAAGGGNGAGGRLATAATSAVAALSNEGSLSSSSRSSGTQKQGGTGAVAVPSGLVNVAAPLSDWRAGVSNLSQKLPLDLLNRMLGHFSHPTGSSSSRSSSSSSIVGASDMSKSAKAPLDDVKSLLAMPAFQTTTLAAALNDLGSYALIAWQSIFYERVYGLDSSVYAPLLAVILPVGGIVGGVGGGLIADWLSTVGGRYWLTAGASILAAPFIAESLLSDSSQGSFLALLVGFALSEAWRAPSAIMIRGVAPQEMGSTASAMYLCIRNLVGGLGPLAVAKLAEVVGLQHAMLLAPSCYVISGLLFLLAEKEIEEMQQQQAVKEAPAATAEGERATAAAASPPPPPQPAAAPPVSIEAETMRVK